MNMSGNIMVSVFVLAYNHQKYIRETLEGFLMQKTDFEFEVLVHEDASTDKTAEILREYETKYPDIIKVVYEKVNKYKTGVDYFYDILLPLARGKYIAVCEGDDAWIDECKLQIQVDYMEKHPECSLLGHKAFVQYPSNWSKERDPRAMGFNLPNMIVPYGRIFFDWQIPTASYMFSKATYIDMPQFFRDAPTGDEPLEFYLAEKGEVHFMNRVMSVYNKMTSSSFSVNILKNTWDNMVKYYAGYIALFDGMDKYTNYTKSEFFDDCIKERIRRAVVYIFLNSKTYSETGSMLKRLADNSVEKWREYILERQSECFGFWNEKGSYWDCAREKDIYVYGAGGLGKKFIKDLLPDWVKVKGVIVSGKEHKSRMFGIKIISLDEYIEMNETNTLIIIAVGDEFAHEIIETLKSRKLSNYRWIYEDVYGDKDFFKEKWQ